MAVLLVSPNFETLIDANGAAVWIESSKSTDPTLTARRVSEEELHRWAERVNCSVASIRMLLSDFEVARSVALLRHHEQFRFDPLTGLPLKHDGDTATTEQGRTVFPRIDPAVIGIVELADQSRILLGRNRLRPQYFSLIAGYVALGETLEETFRREVLEETGRNVRDVRYLQSQPWPISGSIMMGFHGVTDDMDPIQETDDELEEIRWASVSDLKKLPLAAPGSIAYRLIKQWAQQQEEQERRG